MCTYNSHLQTLHTHKSSRMKCATWSLMLRQQRNPITFLVTQNKNVIYVYEATYWRFCSLDLREQSKIGSYGNNVHLIMFNNVPWQQTSITGSHCHLKLHSFITRNYKQQRQLKLNYKSKSAQAADAIKIPDKSDNNHVHVQHNNDNTNKKTITAGLTQIHATTAGNWVHTMAGSNCSSYWWLTGESILLPNYTLTTPCIWLWCSSARSYNQNNKSSATVKSTAHPSCLVRVLCDIYWERICWWLINHFHVMGTESYRVWRNNANWGPLHRSLISYLAPFPSYGRLLVKSLLAIGGASVNAFAWGDPLRISG